jgi:hypothetical protein
MRTKFSCIRLAIGFTDSAERRHNDGVLLVASLDQQYLDLLSNVAAGGPDGAGGLALRRQAVNSA